VDGVNRVGFMQGRLSPLVNGKIQAFPWDHWRDEFIAAQRHGFPLMEWTLDQDRLHENPLMTQPGRVEIRRLMATHGVTVASLTGDCFMQAPFYKAEGVERARLLDDLKKIVESCAEVGIRFIVAPLVDHGRLETLAQEDNLRAGLEGIYPVLKQGGMKIVFESDYAPAPLAALIGSFPQSVCGINYDIGNSASLGFEPVDEITTYGARIDNVHVKDRKRGGSTVPLGTGDANFPVVFRTLAQTGYSGNLILQTARAADDDHAGALCRYRDMVAGWLAH
jgi:hexulose-6-phosphate isomerase